MNILTFQRAEWIARIGCMMIMASFWIRVSPELTGFLFIFALLMLLVLRWRFSLPTWTLTIDCLIYLLFIPYWQWTSLALILLVYEIALRGRPIYLVAIGALIFYDSIQTEVFIPLLFSGFVGWCIYTWKTQGGNLQREMDEERQEKYELEALNQDLLESSKRSAHFAELKERNRIAAELHDHVGHEVTGARLAFQAYEHLSKENSPNANQMFNKAQERLSEAARQLRDTSHNLKPIMSDHKERLRNICHQFDGAPVQLHLSGQTESAPPHHWVLLESCLKESLTNISRHCSHVSSIKVDLDITDQITRLRVHNDGIIHSSQVNGTGIRNLRQRARALGGSVSIDKQSGFSLVCVLPITQKEPLL
ncbi:sensor histidine kinase [Alkalicoccobacillus plakortidis]|uniref:histidine kinase n=1 Tax=Alkalicoccobacillus plakortidis TaxID=444060 RepID=A0ABT0XHS2_9BACI|nr:histidine kinase [Alkalicoccobacillus plakortidis]MCM2674893.1 histidine kinase [Alkalicoccobacillus plakortidis]